MKLNEVLKERAKLKAKIRFIDGQIDYLKGRLLEISKEARPGGSVNGIAEISEVIKRS